MSDILADKLWGRRRSGVDGWTGWMDRMDSWEFPISRFSALARRSHDQEVDVLDIHQQMCEKNISLSIPL